MRRWGIYPTRSPVTENPVGGDHERLRRQRLQRLHHLDQNDRLISLPGLTLCVAHLYPCSAVCASRGTFMTDGLISQCRRPDCKSLAAAGASWTRRARTQFAMSRLASRLQSGGVLYTLCDKKTRAWRYSHSRIGTDRYLFVGYV